MKGIDFSNRLVIGTQPMGLGVERMDSQVGENLSEVGQNFNVSEILHFKTHYTVTRGPARFSLPQLATPSIASCSSLPSTTHRESRCSFGCDGVLL